MNHFFLLFSAIIIAFSSCRSDFETVASTGNLEFSKSKIYLDTVFNNIGSSTYGLKVYNRSSNDIKIPVIKFGKGTTSKYRMMVDGMTGVDADNNGVGDGKVFNNVELLAKDSLFIFIEITHDTPAAVPLEFTYDDQILFDTGSNQQKVDLTTLIWDANFIFPNRPLPLNIKETLNINGNATDIIGHRLTDNDFSPVGSWQFSNLKPTVIYGYALVPTGKTLTITDGASLYFHADTYSGLIIEDGGNLIIDGHHPNYYDSTTGVLMSKNEITFEADRLEPDFEDTPGQWGGIFIISNNAVTNANNNKISYLTLKNSTFGIYTQNGNGVGATPNLDIKNTKIFNSSVYGMLNRNTNVLGSNLVINGGGQASLRCFGGGNYNFTHCTFNNNWSSSSQRAVLIEDYYEDNTGTHTSIPIASFNNCIIHGNFNQVEIKLDYKFTTTPPTFNNCLFKFNDTDNKYNISLYNFINGMLPSTTNIRSNDAKFKNASKNKLNILAGSPADNLGQFNYLYNMDINEKVRSTGNADAGAYQVVP